MMPDGYKVSPGNQNLSTAVYPSGKAYQYFPSAETPAGDDKPCASHEWSGIVFVPGINEVLLPRFGWFHAMLATQKWRVGPQTTNENRVCFKNRGGVFFNCHYLAKTGLVYMTSEGGQISDNSGYYSIVKYDPLNRKEVGGIGFDAACGGCDSVVDKDGLLWFFNGDGEGQGQKVKISTVNLLSEKAIRARTDCSGRRPCFDDGDNPTQYIPNLDKILMWCTRGRASEAQAGEMLEFDRTKLEFKLFPIEGTPAPVQRLMNNKVRYWPKQKVLVFQLATNVNARVIKLAK
jgi:hypothetical protein